MRRKITLSVLILISLLTFQNSFGQEKENINSRFGLGVSLFNIVDYSSDEVNSFYATVNIGSKFRLEPKVGFVIHDGLEQLSIGIGAFKVKPISHFNFLYGIRLGYSTNVKMMIAPTVGGEYYFIKNFSIGAEVQLLGAINDGNFVVVTNSSVIFRFYF